MIMINAIVLTDSSADEEPIWELRSTFSPPLVSERHGGGNYIRHFRNRNARRSKHRLKCDKNWDVEPLIVKLKVVLDRYDLNWGKLKALYAPVEPCVPDKCGKTRHVIPRNLLPKRFKCAKFKEYKRLKKKLNIETETVVTKKRLKFSRQQRRFALAPAGTFVNHTYLLINEWLILQDSKKFLHVWKESLSDVFKCWQELIRRRGC